MAAELEDGEIILVAERGDPAVSEVDEGWQPMISATYDPSCKLVQFIRCGEETFGTLEPISEAEWQEIVDRLGRAAPFLERVKLLIERVEGAANDSTDSATSRELGQAIEEFSGGRNPAIIPPEPDAADPLPRLRLHLQEVLAEAVHQDGKMRSDPPELWAPHRNGVRLYLSALEDEVREAREAWDYEKKPAGEADPERWEDTRRELVQVAAAALRAVRALTPEPATPVGGSE